MADAGPRTAIAVLVFEVAALLLLLALGLAGCASAPMQVDYLDRGIVACTVTPSDGRHPCILELETSDDRVLATLRGLTGCVVRTRQILRQPDPGVF